MSLPRVRRCGAKFGRTYEKSPRHDCSRNRRSCLHQYSPVQIAAIGATPGRCRFLDGCCDRVTVPKGWLPSQPDTTPAALPEGTGLQFIHLLGLHPDQVSCLIHADLTATVPGTRTPDE